MVLAIAEADRVVDEAGDVRIELDESTASATVINNTLAVAEKATFSKEIQINGALNHDGTAVGFFGATPTTQRSGTLYQKLSAGASLTDVINKVNAYIQVLDDLGFVNI